MFEYWPEGLKLILGVVFIIGLPCVGTAILGSRLISELGQYPTESARVHVTVFPWLLALEFCSFILWAVFFHLLLD